MHKAEIEQCIEQWLAHLPDEHWWVIQRRFGLAGQAVATLEAVARDLEVSVEQARQIEVQALEGLALGLRKLGLEPAGEDHDREASARGSDHDDEQGARVVELVINRRPVETEEDHTCAKR
jgi:hypothetical protein